MVVRASKTSQETVRLPASPSEALSSYMQFVSHFRWSMQRSRPIVAGLARSLDRPGGHRLISCSQWSPNPLERRCAEEKSLIHLHLPLPASFPENAHVQVNDLCIQPRDDHVQTMRRSAHRDTLRLDVQSRGGDCAGRNGSNALFTAAIPPARKQTNQCSAMSLLSTCVLSELPLAYLTTSVLPCLCTFSIQAGGPRLSFQLTNRNVSLGTLQARATGSSELDRGGHTKQVWHVRIHTVFGPGENDSCAHYFNVPKPLRAHSSGTRENLDTLVPGSPLRCTRQ